ncbi:MAG: PQQ-dependent sugar dehydrogenase [Actinomycetota bacterium]
MGRLRFLASTLVAIAACSPTAPAPPSPPILPSPAPASPEPTTPTPDPPAARVRPVRVATLTQPLALAVRPGDDTLYIAQKTGQVAAIRGDGTQDRILDLSQEVSGGTEQGLLGLAFSPDGSFLYVNYTDLGGDTRIHEFAVRDGRVDRGSRREVLAVDQPFSNHNGGNLVFGPDGYLYVGLGDGGSGGDPEDNAQDLGTLLGKMLRIDPRPSDGRPYGIPPDNPFRGRAGARPEIWAFGLRNPWRYSFDAETGDLWLGDVGQSEREEIDVQAAGSAGGENYGWDAFEGSVAFEPPFPTDTVGPVYDYGRNLGASVVGGYVYRGSAIPALRGAYLFGDFYNPQVRMLIPSQRGYRHVRLGIRVNNMASFGQDGDGELYLVSLSGPVFRLAPA